MFCIIRCKEDLLNDPNIEIKHTSFRFKDKHWGSVAPNAIIDSVYLGSKYKILSETEHTISILNQNDIEVTLDKRFIRTTY